MTLMARTETEDDLLIATFHLGAGVFGLDTGAIQEVVMTGEITPVRHAPPYVAGIRNLRGRIITVIDLCRRLDLGAATLGRESRILVAEWKGEPIGLLVDRVADALALEPEALETAPPNLHGVQMQKMRGVFRCGERLAALLDLDAVLATADLHTTGEERRG